MVNTKNNKKLPRHVAVIMDGNGRWAQRRFLPRTAGHAKGAGVVRELLEHCAKLGIECLTLFAFSTENWQRPPEEVGTLMGLFTRYLEDEMNSLAQAGVRLKVVGDLGGFSEELRRRILAVQSATASNKAFTLCVAANYGGRWDVVQAVKDWQLANPGLSVQELTQESLAGFLSTAGLPEVDLLIRTGGEQRISNFLLWQCAYSELYFTDVLWPEFGCAEFDLALDWFSKRSRRFGKTGEQVTKILDLLS